MDPRTESLHAALAALEGHKVNVKETGSVPFTRGTVEIENDTVTVVGLTYATTFNIHVVTDLSLSTRRWPEVAIHTKSEGSS